MPLTLHGTIPPSESGQSVTMTHKERRKPGMHTRRTLT
jgi:hypothetical protein